MVKMIDFLIRENDAEILMNSIITITIKISLPPYTRIISITSKIFFPQSCSDLREEDVFDMNCIKISSHIAQLCPN